MSFIKFNVIYQVKEILETEHFITQKFPPLGQSKLSNSQERRSTNNNL